MPELGKKDCWMQLESVGAKVSQHAYNQQNKE
jgi:hypothetical protein